MTGWPGLIMTVISQRAENDIRDDFDFIAADNDGR